MTQVISEQERREAKIKQLADFDFAELCRKLNVSAMTIINHPYRNTLGKYEDVDCTVCGEKTSLDELCMKCIRVATAAVHQTVSDVERTEPGFFRNMRLGERVPSTRSKGRYE